jgi:hypothetical protein
MCRMTFRLSSSEHLPSGEPEGASFRFLSGVRPPLPDPARYARFRSAPMFSDNKAYPILFIVACVGIAIVLMLWALYGTNGPTSLDASKKAPQTTGSTSR